ncbi:MAG TPA: glycosyltransferase family 39 protein [Thermoleophilaceae bacterium]
MAGVVSPFARRLLAVALLGLAARIAYGLLTKDASGFKGDALYYHLVANNVADGHGWAAPFRGGGRVATAFHLPLFPTVLAAFSLVGLDSETAHMIVGCALGAVTVALVGVIARRLAGDAAGLAAALIAAIYPGLVMNDSVLLSESLTGPTIAACLLAALHLRERPGAGRALLLGALIGIATLNRSEAILLVLLLGVPAVLPARSVKPAALLCLASVLTIAPWVIRNAVTFERSTFLTTGDGSVLRGANCDLAYRGQRTGDWDFRCLAGYRVARDESILAARWRDEAFDYAGDNLGRVPVVVAARVGRSFSLYPSPGRQVNELDFIEDRPRALVWIGLAAYAAVVALSAAGIAALRARPDLVAIVLAPVALVVLTSAAGYGSWRFRQPAEVSFVVLAGIGLTWMMGRRRHA